MTLKTDTNYIYLKERLYNESFFQSQCNIAFNKNQLFAQHEITLDNDDIEGIYHTLSHFKTGKLTPLIDRLHKEDKIKLNQINISP